MSVSSFNVTPVLAIVALVILSILNNNWPVPVWVAASISKLWLASIKELACVPVVLPKYIFPEVLSEVCI